jgi:hypothetical protein
MAKARKQPLWVWILVFGVGVALFMATSHGFNAPMMMGQGCPASAARGKETFVPAPPTKVCPDGTRSSGPCLMEFPGL